MLTDFLFYNSADVVAVQLVTIFSIHTCGCNGVSRMTINFGSSMASSKVLLIREFSYLFIFVKTTLHYLQSALYMRDITVCFVTTLEKQSITDKSKREALTTR